MSINTNYSFMARQNPDTYAQQYANQKGISLEEAKEELKSQFGAPSQGSQIPNLSLNGTSSVSSAEDEENQYTVLDLNSDSNVSLPDMDPDAYLTWYANEHNLTIEEAKEELKEKYGDPQQREFIG